MTRDNRTISAVFMAVVLILASGTAVSLAVTESSTSDVGTNAVAVQEETTTPEETTLEEEEDETTPEEEEEEQPASITFEDQETDGETVVIESVTMEEGGFVAIHDSSVGEAPIASVLGNSVYLEAGTHENVEITLARPIEEDQTLVAMPHFDTNDNEVYDFVLSTGEVDGPYTFDGEAITDDAEVTLAEETTPPEEEEEEEEVETTTPEEEEEVVETTTPEEEEEEVVETTTPEEEEEVVETTTPEEEEEVVETTTPEEEEEEVVETTTPEEEEEEVVEEPTEERQLIFKVEEMQIDEWSFVVGDEEEPDRTEVISDVIVQDRRVEINLTEVLQEQEERAAQETITTPGPEAQEQLQEDLTGDIETVRFVIRNVNVENVTFVITVPEDMEVPEPPEEVVTTMPEEEEEVVETTTPEEEEEVVETTTPEEEEEVVETTTPEEEEEVVETTTPEEEEEVVETTTPEEEEEVVETTTPEEEEEVVETTTPEEEEEVVETTTPEEEEEEVELDSFEVSNLDAPESADVGETILVSATVSNPNDQEATQDVAFRLDGTVIERESVTLEGGEETTVTFEVDTADLPADQYIHGIYTRDFGELAVIVLEEPTEAVTATPAETTTTEEA